MKPLLITILCCLLFSDIYCQEVCLIDIECNDCLPDNLPTVLSHAAHENIVIMMHGEEVTFHCHGSKFVTFPEKNEIKAFCENGSFRIPEDSRLMFLSDLGCQTDYFEDVLHHVEFCNDPSQGRSYQYHNTHLSKVLHLGEICYDSDAGRTLFAHMTFANKNDIVNNPHSDQSKVSMLGNFNKMLDSSNKMESEKVYEKDTSMNKRMMNLLGNDKFNFVGENLVTSRLLPARFFDDQNGKASKYVSNNVAVWKSLADGNLRHVQDDIVNEFKRNDSNAEVYTGTHGVLSLQMDNGIRKIYLRPGRKYPVPKYIWTVVYNKAQEKAVAIVTVNDPFILISEIRNAIFCGSACNVIPWLKNLKNTNNFERIRYGLTFCCDIHSFTNVVKEAPQVFKKVRSGDAGLLKDF